MTGSLVVWQWYIPHLRAFLGDRIHSIRNDEFLATTVSYGALHNLENGKEAQAKSSLANQVVRYYRQLKNAQQLSPEQKKFLDSLEEAITKSETLKEKLLESEPR